MNTQLFQPDSIATFKRIANQEFHEDVYIGYIRPCTFKVCEVLAGLINVPVVRRCTEVN